MGSIAAVAVWDHQPSPRELLDQRLSRGWRPTPSLLQGGERILGYAGCAVTDSPHRVGAPHRVSGPRRVSEPPTVDGAP